MFSLASSPGFEREGLGTRHINTRKETVLFFLQKGKHFESYTLIIDLENMNLRRHYYWPAIKITQEVGAQARGSLRAGCQARGSLPAGGQACGSLPAVL